jgi:hypothetical protein
MRTHEIDVTNLIPVKPYESYIVTLVHNKDLSGWTLKTVVGDLVELDNYQKVVSQ